jgi:hypothetical protein
VSDDKKDPSVDDPSQAELLEKELATNGMEIRRATAAHIAAVTAVAAEGAVVIANASARVAAIKVATAAAAHAKAVAESISDPPASPSWFTRSRRLAVSWRGFTVFACGLLLSVIGWLVVKVIDQRIKAGIEPVKASVSARLDKMEGRNVKSDLAQSKIKKRVDMILQFMPRTAVAQPLPPEETETP